MNKKEIVSQKDSLEHLFNCGSKFVEDPEMLAHWSKYLCILTSGFIENAIKYYFSEFSREKSHSFVSNYVINNIEKFQNPNMEKILNLAGAFDTTWREEIEKFVTGERKDAIDSIVANRHSIAHGKSVSLTFARMKKYFESTVEFVEFLKKLCKC